MIVHFIGVSTQAGTLMPEAANETVPEVANETVLACAILLLLFVSTQRVRQYGLFSAELIAPAAALIGGAAALHGVAYASSLGAPAWALLALMSVGTLLRAGHPFQYIEPLAEWLDDAVERVAESVIGRSNAGAAVGVATSGLCCGLLGVTISAALGASFRAHGTVRDTAGLATGVVAVGAGAALSTPALLLLPAEPSHRRIDVIVSIAAAQAAVSLAYATATA